MPIAFVYKGKFGLDAQPTDLQNLLRTDGGPTLTHEVAWIGLETVFANFNRGQNTDLQHRQLLGHSPFDLCLPPPYVCRDRVQLEELFDAEDALSFVGIVHRHEVETPQTECVVDNVILQGSILKEHSTQVDRALDLKGMPTVWLQNQHIQDGNHTTVHKGGLIDHFVPIPDSVGRFGDRFLLLPTMLDAAVNTTREQLVC